MRQIPLWMTALAMFVGLILGCSVIALAIHWNLNVWIVGVWTMALCVIGLIVLIRQLKKIAS